MLKRRLLALILTIYTIPFAYGNTYPDAANIRIRLTGPIHDNRYFLCIPNIGCLSVLAATKGKVYPILHPFEIDGIFVTNLINARVSAQGRPSSCSGTIDTNHTVTITGHIEPAGNDNTYIAGLHCSIS